MTGELQILADSLARTHELAGRIALRVKAELQRPGGLRSILIGLSGDLGAGKTAFVQGFVRALAPGTEHWVTSPTFAVVQTYETEPPATHIDLYRLGALEDLEAIGYRDHYFAPGVTLVEWITRVPEALPLEWLEIRLAVLPSDVRDIRIRTHGERLQPLIDGLLD